MTAGLAPLRFGPFSPFLPHLAIREGYYEERGVTPMTSTSRPRSGVREA